NHLAAAFTVPERQQGGENDRRQCRSVEGRDWNAQQSFATAVQVLRVQKRDAHSHVKPKKPDHALHVGGSLYPEGPHKIQANSESESTPIEEKVGPVVQQPITDASHDAEEKHHPRQYQSSREVHDLSARARQSTQMKKYQYQNSQVDEPKASDCLRIDECANLAVTAANEFRQKNDGEESAEDESSPASHRPR